MAQKRYSQAVYDINRNKLCDLYDSATPQAGQAENVAITKQTNGWKEITFRLPRLVNGKLNYRTDFIKNEYLVRLIEGDYIDWYTLTEPAGIHNGNQAYYDITCPHLSVTLKKKNLYLEFTDENGIGPIQQLVETALAGTGWTLSECDKFYEADGVTEKVRTYTADIKKGTYTMIDEICDIFVAFPTYHGDTKTVEIHARGDKSGLLELNFGKNSDNIQRTSNSSDIITRLYVEGEYGDYGYVGIDDVNPTGLSFILNFDYYKDIGMFTDVHQAALDTYLATMKSLTGDIMDDSATVEENATKISEMWGSYEYVIYPIINGEIGNAILGMGATEDDAPLKQDDVVAVVKANGVYSYNTWTGVVPDGTIYLIKFLVVVAGTLGGKEVAIEAKQGTVETLQENLDKSESEKEKENLQAEISKTQEAIATLKSESYSIMNTAIQHALMIELHNTSMVGGQEAMQEAEIAFANAMGEMLKDGYWSDSRYTIGQEASLYADALEISKEMAYPQVSYTITVQNLSGITGYEAEVFKLNMALHVLDLLMMVNDYAFITETVEYPDAPEDNTITISTDELDIGSKTFESILNRIVDVAELVRDKKTIYNRAAALSQNGKAFTTILEGEINVLQNRLASTTSNWYTDAQGNMIFESLDGQSAMMLCGSGFMCANGKREDGSWNWRTFGTGEGFTADLITTGILRAGIITILGSDQFYWDADNIYVIDPDNENRQIRIGRYDGVHYGIGYTQDGGKTWQNAIGFDGVNFTITNEVISEIVNEVKQELPTGKFITARYSNGNYFTEDITSTVAQVYVHDVNGEDITDQFPDSAFSWTRTSTDPAADAIWNAAHKSMKSTTITTDDIDFTAVIRCVFDASLAYPAVYIDTTDGNLYIDHYALDPNGKLWIDDEGNLMSQNDVYSMEDNGNLYADFKEKDIPYAEVETTFVDRTDDPYIAELRTSLDITNEAITATAERIEADLDEFKAEVQLTADGLSSRVTTVENGVTTLESEFEQTSQGFEQRISSVESNSVYQGDTAPSSPTLNKLWLDTSVTPNMLKRWDGTQWVDVGEDVDLSDYYTKTETEAVITQTTSGLQSQITQVTTTANGAYTNASTALQTANSFEQRVTEVEDTIETGVPKVTTSGIKIAPNQVQVETPNFSVIIPGQGEQLSIDSTGISADYIVAPNLVQYYTGPTQITINPSAIPNGTSQFRSIGDAFEVLSNKILRENVTITYSNGVSDVLNGSRILRTCIGARVSIVGNGAHIQGRLSFTYCDEIAMQNLTVQGTSIQTMEIILCKSVSISNCVITSNTGATVLINSSSVSIQNTEINTMMIALAIGNMSHVYSKNLSGTGGTEVQSGSIYFADGTIISGGIEENGNCLVVYDGASTDSGTGAGETTTTYTGTSFTSTNTRSYGTSSGWLLSDYGAFQGYTSGRGTLTGCIWFNNTSIRSTLSGKTISAASLRLRRIGGYGKGDAVEVTLWGITNSSPSGSISRRTNYGLLGTINQKEVRDFTIPSKAVIDLVSGTIQGLALYNGENSETFDGYSSNYAVFTGSNSTENAPQLTVTYAQ